jgi:hypothetical protein
MKVLISYVWLASGFTFGNVSAIQIVLQRWTARDRRWKKKGCFTQTGCDCRDASSNFADERLAFDTKWTLGLKGNGDKRCGSLLVQHIWHSCIQLLLVPPPLPWQKVRLKYYSATVSATVTFQVTNRLSRHGTSVKASGRLPSAVNRPLGSFVAGTPCRMMARHSRSVRKWLPDDQPARCL